ncbi:MAG: MFS transporter [Chloroflexota bacterium]
MTDLTSAAYSPPASSRLLTRDFALLCTTGCLNFAVHMLAVTSLPLLITGPIGGTEGDVGLALSAFYVAAVLLRVPLGRLIDIWGRRAVMTLCLGFLILTSGGYLLAGSVLGLLVVRALHGACFAGYGTAGNTMVGDIVPAQRRGEALGYYGLLGHVALAVTPWIAFQTIQNSGFGALYLLAAVLAALGVLGALSVREPPRPAVTITGIRSRLILGLFHPAAFRPAIILCLFTMVYAAQILFLPLYARVQGVDDPGLYFAVYGGILMLVRGPAGRISDRIGRGPAIIPGLALSTVSMLILSIADTLPLMLVSGAIFATAFALVTPSLNALVVDITQPSERGSAMATHTTFFDIGTGVGAALCGFLAERIGFPATYAAGSTLGLIAISMYAAVVWRRVHAIQS